MWFFCLDLYNMIFHRLGGMQYHWSFLIISYVPPKNKDWNTGKPNIIPKFPKFLTGLFSWKMMLSYYILALSIFLHPFTPHSHILQILGAKDKFKPIFHCHFLSFKMAISLLYYLNTSMKYLIIKRLLSSWSLLSTL